VLNKLNWFGFFVVLFVCAAGATANKNVTNFKEWLFLMLIIGLPSSILFLIVGREE